MCQAGDQLDPPATTGKCPIGRASVALDPTTEVHGHEIFDALRRTTGLPTIERRCARCVSGPQISQSRLSAPRVQIADRRFVQLNIPIGHHFPGDLFINGLQPKRRLHHPISHVLARKINLVPRLEDHLLTIKWEMITILADDDRGQQTRPHHAPLHRTSRKLCGQWGFITVFAHKGRAHRATKKKARGLIIDLLAHLTRDFAVGFGFLLHFLGQNSLLLNRQIRRPAFVSIKLPTTFRAGRFWIIKGIGLHRGSGGSFQTKKQKQLRLIHLLAFGTKEPATKRIELAFQQSNTGREPHVLFHEIAFASPQTGILGKQLIV